MSSTSVAQLGHARVRSFAVGSSIDCCTECIRSCHIQYFSLQRQITLGATYLTKDWSHHIKLPIFGHYRRVEPCVEEESIIPFRHGFKEHIAYGGVDGHLSSLKASLEEDRCRLAVEYDRYEIQSNIELV